MRIPGGYGINHLKKFYLLLDGERLPEQWRASFSGHSSSDHNNINEEEPKRKKHEQSKLFICYSLSLLQMKHNDWISTQSLVLQCKSCQKHPGKSPSRLNFVISFSGISLNYQHHTMSIVTNHCVILKVSIMDKIAEMMETEELKRVAFQLVQCKCGQWVGKLTILHYVSRL